MKDYIQFKVSMVMPCYNKVKHIAGMFESIIAQEWDNIELILVNDGSTDGTRELITEYEPKLLTRGYDVVIIDQENAGVCAAAKAGLERISGDYVCMVDADDELDPKYVSTMAGWLEEHEAYDLAACKAQSYTGFSKDKVFCPFYPGYINSNDPYYIEKYLLAVTCPTVWIYMVRAEYFHRCRIAETYYTDTKGSHEPGYIIPLLAYGGRLKFFENPLYRFYHNVEGHSYFSEYENLHDFFDEHYNLYIRALNAIPDSIVDNSRKEKLNDVALVAKYVRIFRRVNNMVDGTGHREAIITRMLDLLAKDYYIAPHVSKEMPMNMDALFIRAIEIALTEDNKDKFILYGGRIIGYGALGKASSKLLPLLADTRLEPTELWDINGDGKKVMKPDFGALQSDDLVLVFPKGSIEAELREEFSGAPFRTMYNDDIWELLPAEYFRAI